MAHPNLHIEPARVKRAAIPPRAALPALLVALVAALCVLTLPYTAAAQDTNPHAGTDTVPALQKKQPQRRLTFDTSTVTIRRPSEAAMEAYRRDGDFAYDRTEQKAPTSLLERILKWIFGGGIDRAAGVSTGTFTKTLAWILGLTALAYAILKITNTDLRAIFRRKPLAGVGPIIEAGEDIHEMSFDQLIAEALAKKDFRRAVRLNYLKQIRALSDRSLIVWRIDKTNRQYLFELSAADLRKSFGDITRLFEYVWYGDAQVNEQLYQHLSPRFDAFHSMLGGTS